MQVESADLHLFRSVLGESGVLTDAADTKSFTTDWMNKYFGERGACLVF